MKEYLKYSLDVVVVVVVVVVVIVVVEGKFVKNLEKFWRNYKLIIEFGCRIMWRIMQILEGFIQNIFLDLHNSSHYIRPHSTIVKYASVVLAVSPGKGRVFRIRYLPHLNWK